MNIWIMNHYATPMLEDKAGRHYWFAKELEKRGHIVTVFCATTDLNTTRIVDTQGRMSISKKDGSTTFVFITVPSYSSNGMDRVMNMFKFGINLMPVSKEYSIKNGKPDVIIASSVHPLTMVAGIRIGKKLKVPCICEIRDLWPEAIFAFGKAKEKSLMGKLLVAGEHWIYRKADALIFTKEGDTDYLKEKRWTTEQGGNIDLKKCFYINNGVDLKNFDEKVRTKIVEDEDLKFTDRFNVIYTGTIRPVNNIGNLLDCAKLIAKNPRYSDIRFLIYGDGSELEKLKSRIIEESIDNVKLKGRLNRQFIPYVLSRSSVNVLNYSQKEYNWSRGNSSNKLFEYMASGKPVISTVKMGYSIISRYKCGIELDECTSECLAKAIMCLHDVDEKILNEYGANARNGAEEFDFSKLTDKLMIVIESVMK